MNDVKFGRVNPKRLGSFLREVIRRRSLFQRRKFIVFKEMFQNNMLVDRPHLKADADKYREPYMYLLRNFGFKRFNYKKRSEVREHFAFLRWVVRRRPRNIKVPYRQRKKIIFILRLWKNKSVHMII